MVLNMDMLIENNAYKENWMIYSALYYPNLVIHRASVHQIVGGRKLTRFKQKVAK